MAQPDFVNHGCKQSFGLRRTGVFLFLAFFGYVSIYFVLSLNGQYEPEIVGAQGVKSYVWAPAAFYRTASSDSKFTTGWNPVLQKLFYPLWRIDARYIHKPR
jgi:hypothetical protein